MLRRRYYPKEKTIRETKGREEKNEAGGGSRDTAGSIFGRLENWRLMMPENKSDSSEKRKRRILEDLPAIAGAVIVALIIRTFVFQSFYVPSDSMFPSLLVGDHLFVSKFNGTG